MPIVVSTIDILSACCCGMITAFGPSIRYIYD
jgi:hypothetical protein